MMREEEEKRGGIEARAVVLCKPSSGERAEPYASAGASKCLAPCKLYEKSLAMLETCEFHPHSRRYPGTRSLYLHNYSHHIDPIWLKCCTYWLLLSNILMLLTLIVKISHDVTYQIRMSFKSSPSLARAAGASKHNMLKIARSPFF